eukprot:m.54281 g.54281  ORF g.54281 m.54281 type:complete len:336 (-) comp11407_c0_seq2:4226-5233(-)
MAARISQEVVDFAVQVLGDAIDTDFLRVALWNLGVEHLADLGKVDVSDLVAQGVKVVHARKVLDAFARQGQAQESISGQVAQTQPLREKRVVTVSLDADTIQQDLGTVIQAKLSECPFAQEFVFVLASESGSSFKWETRVIVPPFVHLNLQASNSKHEHVQDDAVQDQTRCPTTITMTAPALMYPNNQPGESYYNYYVYHRLIASPHSHVTVAGLTIDASQLVLHGKAIYEPGIFTVRGPFSSIVLRDCRVHLYDAVCINGHSHGETNVCLGHVRFVGVGPDGTKAFPVTACLGQSWRGQHCKVAITGGKLEGNVEYAPASESKPCQLTYLTTIP